MTCTPIDDDIGYGSIAISLGPTFDEIPTYALRYKNEETGEDATIERTEQEHRGDDGGWDTFPL